MLWSAGGGIRSGWPERCCGHNGADAGAARVVKPIHDRIRSRRRHRAQSRAVVACSQLDLQANISVKCCTHLIFEGNLPVRKR